MNYLYSRELLGVAALIALASPANAELLIDTGPAYGGQPWNLFPMQWFGVEFVLNSAATITSVQGYSTRGGAGNGGTLTAAISVSDGVNYTPGAELFSTEFNGTNGGLGWFGPSGLSWSIGPGTYWLTFEVRGTQSFYGVLGGIAERPLGRENFSNIYGWMPFDALDNAWRIDGVPISNPVPEPSSWSMMVIGLGMLGGALRSRRRSAQSGYAHIVGPLVPDPRDFLVKLPAAKQMELTLLSAPL